MFRDIVSRLPFSPALIGQLGFYAHRLKKEEAVRRMGLVLTAMALVLQSFAVFSPAESANAASENDMIHGGVKSQQQILQAYEQDDRFRSVMSYNGITKQELASTKLKTINNLSNGTGHKAWKSWGWQPRFSQAQGEVRHDANSTSVYSRPHYLYNSSAYEINNGRNLEVYYGKSDKIGDFGIALDGGNLVTTNLPTPPQPTRLVSPKPVVSCENLSLIRQGSTTYQLSAIADAKNGAEISQYTFSVDNANGTTIKRFEIDSSDYNIKSSSFNLAPGDYTAKATIKSANDPQIEDECEKNIVVTNSELLVETTFDSSKHRVVDLDKEFDYQIAVKNLGQSTVSQALVSNQGFENASLVESSDGEIDTLDNSWKATISSLHPGQTQSYTITASITQPEAGVQQSTSCVNVAGSIDCDSATIESKLSEMKVCELISDKIVVINQGDFDQTLYSKNHQDCTKIQVCDLASDSLVTIRQPQLDKSQHEQSVDKCQRIQVCDQQTNQATVIPKDQFNSAIHSSDASTCLSYITSDKTATNLSQGGVDASTVVARAGDRIQYTVRLHNISNKEATSRYDEDLKDVLEYARLTNGGGGDFDEQNDSLSWGEVKLAANQSTSRSFTVTVLEDIPLTARGTGDPTSYDCVMTNTFGNSVDIKVDCGAVKSVESTVTQLPKTGTGPNLIFAGVVASVVTYFYARSRQLSREVRLIRHNMNAGVI